VLDGFLDWHKNRVSEGSKAQRTFDWYFGYLQDFASFKTDGYVIANLTIDQLEPFHVDQWADSHPGWRTGKNGAISAIQRAFNWAAKAGLLKSIGRRSPISGIEKPSKGRREKLVSEGEYLDVLGLVQDDEFRDLVELAWKTGCRPHELFTVTAAFVDFPNARWIFPIRLSKGKKFQRVVWLSDRALEITRRLVLKRPAGPLLLNTEGNPWCKSSVKCRFQLICRVLGRKKLEVNDQVPPKIPRLTNAQRNDPAIRAAHEVKMLERRQMIKDLAREHGIRLNLYNFRHSFITESLVNGLDAVTVSVLAGHRDTTMISRHYGHVAQKQEHMRAAANRARPASALA
jgi:integrase